MTGPIQRNRNVSQSKSASNTMYKVSSRNSRSNFGSEGRIRTFIQATLLITMLTFTFFWMKLSMEEMYFHPFELKNKNLNQSSLSLVTIVLPSVVNPNGRGERLKAIADTWGPSSKAVFVVHADEELPIPDSSSWNEFDFSSMTSISYPAVMRLPEGITEKQGVERLIYVLNALKNGPEFTFFVNDHTFVIPEHLCLFLQNYNGEKDDLYAGHALANTGITYGFNSGASGYVLTKLTLGKLVDAIAEEKDHCTGDKNGWLAGNPGIMTADCLGVTLETRPFDTRTKKGEHIFHAYGLVRTVMGSFDEWYLKKHKNLCFRGESDTDEDHIPSGKLFTSCLFFSSLLKI